jgi:hypothetical protein
MVPRMLMLKYFAAFFQDDHLSGLNLRPNHQQFYNAVISQTFDPVLYPKELVLQVHKLSPVPPHKAFSVTARCPFPGAVDERVDLNALFMNNAPDSFRRIQLVPSDGQ